MELKLDPDELENDELESEDELRERESLCCGLFNGFLVIGTFLGTCSTLVSFGWLVATGLVTGFSTVCFATAVRFTAGGACLVSGGCTVVLTTGGAMTIAGGSSLA